MKTKRNAKHKNQLQSCLHPLNYRSRSIDMPEDTKIRCVKRSLYDFQGICVQWFRFPHSLTRISIYLQSSDARNIYKPQPIFEKPMKSKICVCGLFSLHEKSRWISIRPLFSFTSQFCYFSFFSFMSLISVL